MRPRRLVLWGASWTGQLDVVQRLVADGHYSKQAAPVLHSPLLYAAGNRHLHVVEYLLDNKTQPLSAAAAAVVIMWAAVLGHAKTVEALVDAGISVHNTDGPGWTPLHWAARYGRIDTVAYLIRAGASLEAAATSGVTPLFVAARHGHAAVVGALLEAGSSIEAMISMSPYTGARFTFTLRMEDDTSTWGPTDSVRLMLLERQRRSTIPIATWKLAQYFIGLKRVQVGAEVYVCVSALLIAASLGHPGKHYTP
jgi:ankyrin repeat protein